MNATVGMKNASKNIHFLISSLFLFGVLGFESHHFHLKKIKKKIFNPCKSEKYLICPTYVDFFSAVCPTVMWNAPLTAQVAKIFILLAYIRNLSTTIIFLRLFNKPQKN